MPLAISFELSDRDLEHFTSAIKAATFAAGSMTQEEITAAAGKLLLDAGSLELPDFIMERLDKLDALIAMVRDEGWALPDEDRQRTREAGTGYGSSSGYARSGYTSAWRPGLLRIR